MSITLSSPVQPGQIIMFDLKAYLQAKKEAQAEAKAQAQKAEAKAQAEMSVKAQAEKYASQEVSAHVKQALFGEMHTGLGLQQSAERQAAKAEAAQKAVDADKQALAKLETDLDAIYGKVVSLQEKTDALRAQTKVDKAEVEAKIEELKIKSPADRLAAARAKTKEPQTPQVAPKVQI